MMTDGGGWTLVESYDVAFKEDYNNEPFTNDFPRSEDTPNWDDYRLSYSRMSVLSATSTSIYARCHRDPTLSLDDYFFGNIELVQGEFGGSIDLTGPNPYNVEGKIRGYEIIDYDLPWWHEQAAVYPWHPHFESYLIASAMGSEDAFGWADGGLNSDHLCHTSDGESVWFMR
jgi:hypothetical protein